MNALYIRGYGKTVASRKVMFKKNQRFRIDPSTESQLSLAVLACQRALDKAGMEITEVDCIVSASAVGIQPIPCTAALIHEQIAAGTEIPAIDINTTCTSFISALDTFAYLIEAGRYRNVLIVSSEVSSLGLNPKQKESYELFSDGAAAFIFSKSADRTKGVLASQQKTLSEGAHDTEIRGGGSALPPYHYTEENKEEYQFDMQGIKALSIIYKKLPELFQGFLAQNQLTLEEIDLIVPHQASRALALMMKRMNVPKDLFIDKVSELGNMVSASVPYVFCEGLEEGRIKKDDTILLLGTAAGLTVNFLLLNVGLNECGTAD